MAGTEPFSAKWSRVAMTWLPFADAASAVSEATMSSSG